MATDAVGSLKVGLSAYGGRATRNLYRLFILARENPVLMNVTSGLAFIPAAFVPIYAATKAALHSLSVSLRQQLASTPSKSSRLSRLR
jgi:short-subunit dehydrogenase involved in D-alanine esterification of teichoic acids